MNKNYYLPTKRTVDLASNIRCEPRIICLTATIDSVRHLKLQSTWAIYMIYFWHILQVLNLVHRAKIQALKILQHQMWSQGEPGTTAQVVRKSEHTLQIVELRMK
jgi:hypothetical protein